MNAPAYKGIKKYKDGDNAALRQVIMDATPIAAKQMCDFAEQFRGKTELETSRNIWNFLKHKIKYVADGEYQIVRLPSALLKTKVGDCKSYSVFTSAVLQCLGIPHHYMMTSYRKDNPTPSHIYVMTDSGIIIDAVWHSFNSEKPYAYVYKTKPHKNMKYNKIGLGGSALPPFRVGMGALPTFRIGQLCDCQQQSGMMGAEGAFEWAQRNGISLTIAQKAAIAGQKVLPLAAAGRAVFRNIIQKNAGGIATMLNDVMKASRTQSKGQPEWDKMRKIELEWLMKGGNPNELYESISEGATKTPTGRKFYELIRKVGQGQSPSVGEWLTGLISALFGKKYNASTGAITGEPATTTAIAIGSKEWWAQQAADTARILGTQIIDKLFNKIQPSSDESLILPPSDVKTPSDSGSSKFPTTLVVAGAAGLGLLLFMGKKKKR